ncbi:MAG: hypothetical protein COB67_06380 [SAR324 cluster bacterium]|uniref:Membrane protein insertase YidC n=1 Tax=SAR324 cluster bacterium TaxID=2024889 RepID=A0A2A4T4L9_9DELT|nr:MAG: hypothetical protein COB67_06380 [SAR324 cluster bacterium]
MDKKFLLAFVLSSIVIFAYYSIFPPPQPEPEQSASPGIEQVEEKTTATTPASAISKVVEPLIVAGAAERKTIQVETPFYRLELDSYEAKLNSFFLKEYKYNAKPHIKLTNLVSGLFSGEESEDKEVDLSRLVNMVGDVSAKNKVWKFSVNGKESIVNYSASTDSLQVNNSPQTLTLQAKLPSGLEVIKTLTFYPDTYKIDMSIRVLNRTGETQSLKPRLNFGAANEEIAQEERPFPKTGISYIEEDFEKYDDGDFEDHLKIEKADWAGVMSTYFVSAVKSADKNPLQGQFIPLESRLKGKEVSIPKFEYTDKEFNLNDGQEYNRNFSLYIGPKLQDEMDKYDPFLYESLDLGFFKIIAHPILAILRWLQGMVGNWGIAIILLTLFVRSAMFPLAYKGMISMKRMSQLNPRIKVLREKYKDDKERLNTEIMNFYKKNKVNPVGGCLPMIMQIPIFIGLYSALLPAIELRHQPFFLWMDNLSTSDFTLILPALMGVSMYIQQALTPTPTIDPNQAKMMKWMPVIMVFFFLDMPTGLVLYWVISNVFTIFQQMIFNRIQHPEVQH